MTDDRQTLSDRCASFSKAARDAVDWITDPENSDTVGHAGSALVRTLGRQARRADKLSSAARSNMAVSVFGPSQAGKSFLVSVLARPENGQLVADYAGPDGQLDYISAINPEGEGESTGLVTRFTMTRIQTPDGFPIPLRLLSESDVARTIINSFYRDGDQSETPPKPDEIKALLQTYRGKTGAPSPSMDADGVWEIAEYVESTFARSTYASKLESFWDEAAQIAPNLSLADRADFLAVLWGGHQPLTDLYKQLAGAAERLGNATQVFAPLSALVPRDSSIIDVAALSGLFTGSDTLEVRTADNRTVGIERAVLCALTAELVLPMRDQPHEMFGETDLLDFPGARNRFEVPLTRSLQEPEKNIPQMLLRGKVAYLFDRYVDHQDITSMLLCIPPSNMDTVDLPSLVDNWIAMTHGDTPQKRAAAQCILFFILTKFDMHLGESAAESGASTRFDKRIKMSLLEKFGRQNDPWVDEWTPGTKFQNLFWLRNPNFFNAALFDYSDDGGVRKERLRADQVERMADLRKGCLEAENVQAHFEDPAEAWDAAMLENDGGIGRLLSRLEPACQPASKLGQISGQIAEMEQEMVSALSPYHVSNDLDERIREKEEAAGGVIERLEIALESSTYGAVMARLMVDEDAIYDRVSSVPPNVRINAPRPKPQKRVLPGRPRPGAAAAAADPAAEEGTENGGVRIMTSEAFQSDAALEVWADTLHRFKDDPHIEARYGLTPEAASSLVAELLTASRRCGIETAMKDELTRIQFGLTMERQARPASVILSEIINRFVSRLGFDAMPEAERPVVALEDGEVPVFAARPPVASVDSLPETPKSIVDPYWTDWIHALFEIYRANAKMIDGTDLNHEQNKRIGDIIDVVRQAVAAQ
ncbi:MAG: putative virulence factor [Marinibacterium sp.]|nr:putative virulence factor [Marinibacterium sp.]